MVGCGRRISAVAQENGPGAYGNDYMSMNWNHGTLICRPKRTNKPPQKKAATAKDVKAPKVATRLVTAINNLKALSEGTAKHTKLMLKVTDLISETTSTIKKDFRRVVRLFFKRPCEHATCIPVLALGNIVQACEVKEKKTSHEYTICPRPGCGAGTIFSTEMVDGNGTQSIYFICQSSAQAFLAFCAISNNARISGGLRACPVERSS